MSAVFSFLSGAELAIAAAIALFAGTIKGLVGFALPMILISGLSMFLAPDLALAGLILPALVTNGMQALRQGPRAALASMRRFRVFLLIGLICLMGSAQLVRILPQQVMLLVIGLPVTAFAAFQLMGQALTIANPTRRSEFVVGGIAGLIGGVSGVWGPPTVAYLTALGTEKTEQIRVQGVIYGLGAVALLLAHIGSGVMRAETAPFSLMMIVPGVLGMWLGGLMQDRIAQALFRRITLWILLIAGANLVRRALMM
jgi:uncharacterized membrane protein YfcA